MSSNNQQDDKSVEIKMTKDMTGLCLKTSKKQIIWQVSNCIMGLFFFVAFILQTNDPDPELWMPIYGTSCLLCIVTVIFPRISELFYKYILCICLMITSIILCYLFLLHGHVVRSSADILLQEEGREFGGISIIIIWLLVMLFVSIKTTSNLTPFSIMLIFYVICGPIIASYVYQNTIDLTNERPHCKDIVEFIKNITTSVQRLNRTKLWFN